MKEGSLMSYVQDKTILDKMVEIEIERETAIEGQLSPETELVIIELQKELAETIVTKVDNYSYPMRKSIGVVDSLKEEIRRIKYAITVIELAQDRFKGYLRKAVEQVGEEYATKTELRGHKIKGNLITVKSYEKEKLVIGMECAVPLAKKEYILKVNAQDFNELSSDVQKMFIKVDTKFVNLEKDTPGVAIEVSQNLTILGLTKGE